MFALTPNSNDPICLFVTKTETEIISMVKEKNKMKILLTAAENETFLS